MKFSRQFLRLGWMALGTLLGCTVRVAQTPPSTNVPATFDIADGMPSVTEDLAWWEAFDNPLLSELLAEVVVSNPDLAAAAARVRAARALAEGAGAPQRPRVEAGASAVRAEQSASGLNPLVGAKLPALPITLPDRTENLFRVGFDASWEIDLFGRTRHAMTAAEARVEAAEFTQQDLLRTLLSETARAYIDYRMAEAQSTLLERSIAIRQESEDLARLRQRAGMATELEVARVHAARLSLAAGSPAIATRRDAALRSLAVLTALEPEALRAKLAEGAGIPSGRALLGLGLPADLIRRRPDLRAAERQFAAAAADLGVATADLYPRLTLVGSLGFESIDAGTLGDSMSRFWNLGPRLTVPILQGGALRARKQARTEELVARREEFRSAVLRALREVEGAANRVEQTQRESEARAAAQEAAVEAHRLARQRFEAGLIPMDELLATEDAINAAEVQSLQVQARQAEALVGLGKALGGGWR